VASKFPRVGHRTLLADRKYLRVFDRDRGIDMLIGHDGGAEIPRSATVGDLSFSRKTFSNGSELRRIIWVSDPRLGSSCSGSSSNWSNLLQASGPSYRIGLDPWQIGAKQQGRPCSSLSGTIMDQAGDHVSWRCCGRGGSLPRHSDHIQRLEQACARPIAPGDLNRPERQEKVYRPC